MNDMFKGVDGIASSKRIAGFVIILGVFIISGIAIYKDPTQASDILWPLVSLAGVCFGATAVERIGK